MASSSSSCVPTRGWTYDVFLSFRGEDTRNNFVDHLYGNLIQKGIRVFKDDEMLGGGKPISPELLKAIEESRCAVVVFSKNYANSSWCLDELAKIMQCQDRMGQKVIPVFYHVDPSDVRGQKRDYQTAFEKLEEKFKGDMDKLNKWRKDLTAAANLSGHHFSEGSGGEYAFINKIVQEISGDIRSHGMENNLIGIESHIDALNLLLKMEATEEVRIVGIWGMGGIGKTTIARTLFRRYSSNFHGSSFVNDVRQNDICKLQDKILENILGPGCQMIEDREVGADMIQQTLCRKKVLIVLDDVDKLTQLEFLAAKPEWFGPGSRIIITTRDEHLLSDANAKYKPGLLRMDQAVQLFNTHAFGTHCLPDGYKVLSERAIRYADRLPLALKVLGSFFRGRQACVWESALNRLAKTPNKDIFDTLKLSFDGLEQSEKMIFLDIACFYKGRDVNYVTRIFDSLGFDPEIGISVLIEKCLITVASRRIGMHDLVQEMGWQIIHMNFPNSRLWLPDKIHDFIKKRKELEVIEAIKYLGFKVQGLHISDDAFESMKNLRLLDVDYHFTSCQPTFLPEGLQCLFWYGYPFSSLPVAHMHNLVRLEMKKGSIKHLWKDKQSMPNLKFIHLRYCRSLTRFPDVSGAPNIERLDLYECRQLVEVHESLGDLKRLVYLDMSRCWNLKHLPSRVEMESLETLKLSYCSSLERFPEFSPFMVKLSHIDFSYCKSIEEVPLSIRYLSNISFLNLNGCCRLKNLPKSICELKCKSLLLANCLGRQKLPDEIGSMDKLEELCLRKRARAAESINFRAFTNLCSLRKLDLSWVDIREEDFPKNLHRLSSLEELNLNGNFNLTQLPASISHLSHLKRLLLNDCWALRKLHGLPSELQVLEARKCGLLEIIEDISIKNECLYKLSLFNCELLKSALKYEEYEETEDLSEERYIDKMIQPSILKKWAAVDGSFSIGIPGSKIPSWFKQNNGSAIALKLPPKWQTQIMGFAISVECSMFREGVPRISFLFENKDAFDLKWEADSVEDNIKLRNTWIGYIPFTLFQQIQDDDDKGDDWSSIIEGNVVIRPSAYGRNAVRCGARVLYKEDVESAHQIKQSVSPYYWKWKISRSSGNHNVYIATEK